MTRALLLLTLCAAQAAAQTPGGADAQRASSDPYAIAATVGLHVATTPYGVGATASVSASRNVLAFRVGYDAASNIKSTLTMNAVSASVGVNKRRGWVNTSAYAGPAIMWGQDLLDPQDFVVGYENYRTLGATAGVSAMLGTRFQLGVAASGFVNSRRVTLVFGPRLALSSR